jgi:hypothetical protein
MVASAESPLPSCQICRQYGVLKALPSGDGIMILSLEVASFYEKGIEGDRAQVETTGNGF